VAAVEKLLVVGSQVPPWAAPDSRIAAGADTHVVVADIDWKMEGEDFEPGEVEEELKQILQGILE